MLSNIVLILALAFLHAATGQRCNLPEDRDVFLGSLDNSSQCLQDYRAYTNANNALSTRMQAANRWCRLCAELVSHWFADVCVDLTEAAKIGHQCASNGENLCYFIAQEPSVFNSTELAVTCGLEFANGTARSIPETCSMDCKNALQSAVASTGCCFASAFNVSETPEIERGLASSELWESCELSTSVVEFCPERLGTRNCTEQDLFQYLQTLDAACVADFTIQFNTAPETFDIRVDAAERWCSNCAPTVYNWLLNECGDDIDALEIASICGHDGNRNCFHYTREARFYQSEAETCGLINGSTYLPFPATCPSGCADALQQISTDLGCCFESAFNATNTLTIRLGLANNNLWDICGLDVDSVNFCPNPFTDGGALPTVTPALVCSVNVAVILASILSLAYA